MRILMLALVMVWATVAHAGLYAHWPFEGSGSTYKNDVSGNGYHLTTTTNAVATDGKGFIGNALRLNFNNTYTTPMSHSTSNNEYAYVSGVHGAQANSYTISAVVAPRISPPGTIPANDSFWALAGWNDGSNHYTGLYQDNSGYFHMRHTLSSGSAVDVTGTLAYSTKRYFYVVGVVDRSAGTVKLYVDGAQEGSTGTFTANTAPWDHSSSTFYLGIANPGASILRAAFPGMMDEVRLYDHAISQSDIQHLLGDTSVDPGPGASGYGSSVYTVKVRPYNGGTYSETYTYATCRDSVTNWQYGDDRCVHWAQAFSTGATGLEVSTQSGSITSFSITPQNKDYVGYLSGGKLYIWAHTQHAKLRVVINGDDANPLFLRTMAPFTCPSGSTGSTYNPGIYTIQSTDGHYTAASNETICVKAGVTMRGNFVATNTSNVKIVGPGNVIYDQITGESLASYTYEQKKIFWAVSGDGATNLDVDGPIFVNYPSYGIRGANEVNNVMLLSPWYWSTDGVYADRFSNSLLFVGDSGFVTTWKCMTNGYSAVNIVGATTNNALIQGGYSGVPGPSSSGYPDCWQYVVTVENVDTWSYDQTPDGYNSPTIIGIWVDTDADGSVTSSWGYANQRFYGIYHEGATDGPAFSIRQKDYPWDGIPSTPYGQLRGMEIRELTITGTQGSISEMLGYDSLNTNEEWVIENMKVNGTTVTSGNYSSYISLGSYSSGNVLP